MKTAFDLSDKPMLQQLVTITGVANTAGKYPFPRQPNMQDRPGEDAILKFAEVFYSTEVPEDTLGNPILNEADLNAGYLVLKVEQEEKLQQFPLYGLNAQHYNGRIRPINLKNVQWEQSYIQWPDATVLPAAPGETFMLNVFFEPVPK